MQEGGGLKEKATGRGGWEGGHTKVLQHVWMTPGDGNLFQILGAVDLSGGQWFSKGCQNHGKGSGGVAAVDNISKQGVGDAAGIQIFL